MCRAVGRSRTRWPRHDSGATTVVFALVVLVLFAVAALGVELSNLYTRDRAVQTTADVAAFAGAQGLPDACEAFTQALRNLNADGNAVQDDDSPTAATARDMSDDVLVNGEIDVLRRFTPGVDVLPADHLPTASCGEALSTADPQDGPGRVVRVTTPGSTVAFAFANVFSAFPGREGISSAEVRATATVGLSGPEGASVLPVFLPSGCVTDTGGPAVLLLGPVPGTASPPVFAPAGGDQGPTVSVVSPEPIPAGSSSTLRVRLTGLLSNPALAPAVFDLHTGVEGSPRVPEDPDASVPGGLLGAPVPETSEDGVSRWTATYLLTIDPAVTGTSGEWFVRAKQAPPGEDVWTSDGRAGSFVVAPAPSSPGACAGSTTGDLGLLDLPGAADGAPGRRQQAFVTGLEPAASSFDPTQLPAVDTACTPTGTPPGAVLHDDPDQDGATCLQVLAAEDVPRADQPDLVTAGLLSDGSGGDGRLVAPDLDPPCARSEDGPDLQLPIPTLKVTVVSTTLSCYLAPGADGVGLHSLADVMNGVPGSLREEVFSDPRFAFVPVLGTTSRPPDGSWPVVQFRGAFITDETPGSAATCVSDTDCNGLVLDGTATRLQEVHVLTFPAAALPVSVDQPRNGTAWTAGSKDFLLLE